MIGSLCVKLYNWVHRDCHRRMMESGKLWHDMWLEQKENAWELRSKIVELERERETQKTKA